MKRAMIFGIFLGALAASGWCTEADGIYSFKVGQFEVSMLVERQGQGNAGVLVNPGDAVRRYIPASGFVHSTNVFVIKTPEHRILIDTGFGATIFDKMKSLGIEAGAIDILLLTHMHGDHIGGLQRDGKPLFPNATVYLSAREKTYFTQTRVNQGAAAGLAAYGARVVTFEPAALGSTLQELIPGIYPIAAYGHTPGHTAFLVESGGERLLIAGDFLHVALVQFPRPDISASYDMDQNAAARTRAEILSYAARNKTPIGGMHMAYPAVGNVESAGSGYSFTPR